LSDVASVLLVANRRKLRPSFWPVSRNVIIACAGLCGVALTPHLAFSAPVAAPSPVPGPRLINVDEEILVALNVGRYRLADDITAAPNNGSLCVDVQQAFSALDFPIIVDRSRQLATGWFINENQSVSLNLQSGAAQVGDKKSVVAAQSIGTLSTGACVNIDALASLLGLTIAFDPQGSALTVASAQRLPLIDRLQRQSRGEVGSMNFTQEGVTPRLRSLPYRAFVPPNSDVSISFNRQQAPLTPKSLTSNWSVLSVGELAYMTAEAQLGGTQDGFNGSISRFRLYRTERDGGVFGIDKLTEFSAGDISGYGSSLGSVGGLGLGFSASTFPLNRPTSFDRTNFEGALPAGWDVELYRNGQLLEFRNDGTSGGYSFKDVPVLFGDNNFEIVQYGPQGQRRVINKRINATNFLAPKGDKYYRLAIYRPEVLFGRVSPNSGVRIDLRTAIGIGDNFSLGGGFDSYLLSGKRFSIGTLSAQTSVSGLALNSELSVTSDGRFAGQIEFQGNGKGASLRGRLTVAQDGYRTERIANNLLSRLEGSADRSFMFSDKISGTISGRAQFDRYHGGESSFTARQRITLSRGNAWLAQSLAWSHTSTGTRRDQIDGEFAYSTRSGRQGLRASMEYSIYPDPKLTRVSLSAERSFSVDRQAWRWRGEASWETNENSFLYLASVGREFRNFNLDMVAETDGRNNHRLGVNLSFSLGRRSNGWGITSRPLAGTGTVRARIFQDMDDDGNFSLGDIPVARAAVLSNASRGASVTDDLGYAILDSVAANDRAQINVLTDELDEPNLFARATYTKPREGTVSEISIPLTQMGAIEGTVEMVTGFDPQANPLGGVVLVLLDQQKREVSRTTSAYDGFYSFDLVPVGTYHVALAPDTSLARRLRPRESMQIVTTRAEPGVQGQFVTLVETNPTSTKMALRGLL
jgi:hypothetical protein